ncbi:hypothetical protein NC652_004439 [Populus alba x Populus x berolinensis]|nr:hypothetical protein NC652_004439 [Populus alba x Populus x berolinensis]
MPDALLIEKLDKNFARPMQKGVESDDCCVHCGAVGESREHSQSGLFGLGETNSWSASRFTPCASNKYMFKAHSPCGGARVLNFMIKILFGYYFEIKKI